MNTIKAEFDKSDYDIYGDFLNIKIDDNYIDEYLESQYPGDMYKGMIPTLLFAMENDAESKIVWNRILPYLGNIIVCPILMCPDDRDFSCTLIVAEIECCRDTVKWRRVGMDKTEYWKGISIGTEVHWFEKVPLYEFPKSQYLAMIKAFEFQFELDKTKWVTGKEKVSNK